MQAVYYPVSPAYLHPLGSMDAAIMLCQLAIKKKETLVQWTVVWRFGVFVFVVRAAEKYQISLFLYCISLFFFFFFKNSAALKGALWFSFHAAFQHY